jgi:1,4-alpha-glucan branching enzyme
LISKKYSKSGRKCTVKFKLGAEEVNDAERVYVLGDFNDWNPEATPLERRKKGGFRGGVKLRSGADYRFRYLLDGRRWLTDEEADGTVPNDFGDLDSLLEIPRR